MHYHSHHIAHCTILYWFAHYFSCMCLVLPSRHRHRAVRAGVRAHPSGGSRLYRYRWSDRRALSLHLFYILLSLLLLSFGCDSFESRVLFHLFSLNKLCIPTTTYRRCLLFASLASHSACVGSCCYLDMVSRYVGVVTCSPDTAVNKLLQLKLDVG